MDGERTKIKRLKIHSISNEAKQIYDKLAPNIQDIYRTEVCQMCGAQISLKQLNRIIIEGVPSVCPTHQITLKEQMAALSPLFGQLGLF